MIRLTHAEDQGEERNEDHRREKSNDISCQHGVVGTGCLDGNEAVVELGGCDKPGSKTADETQNWAEGGSPEVLALPHEGKSGGKNSAGDDHTHEDVEPAHADASIEQPRRESSHDNSPSSNARVRNVYETLATGLGVDVSAVDIVSQDGRNGNKLSRESTSDSHEDDQKCSNSTTRAKERNSSVGQGKTSADFGISHQSGKSWEALRALERKSGQAHSGGAEPRDGEPAETADNVSGKSVDWRGGDGLVVV